MTSTDTELDELTFLDFEFEVPCEIRKCEPRVAEWKAITKCCGWIILMCTPHVEDWLEYSSGGGGWICNKCETVMVGSPFISVDKLKQ
jgi:hypothetical protein